MVKFEPCMKKMKISHIVRKYKVTEEDARTLRSGVSTKPKQKPKPVKDLVKVPDPKTDNINIKESNNG